MKKIVLWLVLRGKNKNQASKIPSIPVVIGISCDACEICVNVDGIKGKNVKENGEWFVVLCF